MKATSYALLFIVCASCHLKSGEVFIKDGSTVVTFHYDSCTVDVLPTGNYLVICHNGKSGFSIYKTSEYSLINYNLDTAKEDLPLIKTDVTFTKQSENRFDISGTASFGNAEDSNFCIIDLKNMEVAH